MQIDHGKEASALCLLCLWRRFDHTYTGCTTSLIVGKISNVNSHRIAGSLVNEEYGLAQIVACDGYIVNVARF